MARGRRPQRPAAAAPRKRRLGKRRPSVAAPAFPLRKEPVRNPGNFRLVAVVTRSSELVNLLRFAGADVRPVALGLLPELVAAAPARFSGGRYRYWRRHSAEGGLCGHSILQ